MSSARRNFIPDFEEWSLVIEPIPASILGRYRIYLSRGVIRYGLDGWGWTRWTLDGARRKGARELLRRQRSDKRLELRTAALAGAPTIREMKARISVLENRIATHRMVRPAWACELATLRETLGPLAPWWPNLDAGPYVPAPKNPPKGGSGISRPR